MAKKVSGAAARTIGQTERGAAPRSPVGDAITRHLRELQAQRHSTLEVESVVAALVPAIATLAERGVLVSIAVTPDARSVRLSALIEKEWIPWYATEDEQAAELAAQIRHAFAE